MQKCEFDLNFSGIADDFINKIKTKIESEGGMMNTDTNTFTINISVIGTISGSYEMANQQMRVFINTKPIFISCNQINHYLEKFIASNQ